MVRLTGGDEMFIEKTGQASEKGGIKEIMEHPFFAGTVWKEVHNRKVGDNYLITIIQYLIFVHPCLFHLGAGADSACLEEDDLR